MCIRDRSDVALGEVAGREVLAVAAGGKGGDAVPPEPLAAAGEVEGVRACDPPIVADLVAVFELGIALHVVSARIRIAPAVGQQRVRVTAEGDAVEYDRPEVLPAFVLPVVGEFEVEVIEESL